MNNEIDVVDVIDLGEASVETQGNAKFGDEPVDMQFDTGLTAD